VIRRRDALNYLSRWLPAATYQPQAREKKNANARPQLHLERVH
jgi:hypothetical protein